MKFPTSSRLFWHLLTALYALTFLAILVFAYRGQLPPILTQNDKLAHVVLYAIATYLGHRLLNYRRIRLGIAVLPLFPLLFGIFTVGEEFSQAWSPNRTLDAIDLVASLAGLGLGYGLAERSRAQR